MVADAQEQYEKFLEDLKKEVEDKVTAECEGQKDALRVQRDRVTQAEFPVGREQLSWKFESYDPEGETFTVSLAVPVGTAKSTFGGRVKIPRAEAKEYYSSNRSEGQAHPLGEPTLVNGVLEKIRHTQEKESDPHTAEKGPSRCKETQVSQETRTRRNLPPPALSIPFSLWSIRLLRWRAARLLSTLLLVPVGHPDP